MPHVKVATCCYCGIRAALDLRGQQRHELACSACGAPLSRLKMLPKAESAASVPVHRSAPSQPSRPSHPMVGPKSKKLKKPKKRKGFGKKMFEEIWDVIEDIID